MNTYLRKLSATQWAWLLGCLVLCAAIVAVGWLVSPADSPSLPDLTTDMSIREIAPKLGVTGKSLAREFGLPLDVAKGKPLKKLGVSEHDLEHVAEHLISHRSSPQLLWHL